MKTIEDLVQSLLYYSHAEQHNIDELLDFIEGKASKPQQEKIEVLIHSNDTLAHIVEGFQTYYELYGPDSDELLNYLQIARKEGYTIINGAK